MNDLAIPKGSGRARPAEATAETVALLPGRSLQARSRTCFLQWLKDAKAGADTTITHYLENTHVETATRPPAGVLRGATTW